MKRILFATVLIVGCRTSTPPEEPPVVIVDADAASLLDAGPDASLCARACASLAALGCREANGACLYACDHAEREHLLSDLRLNCITAATTREAMHACGGNLCP